MVDVVREWIHIAVLMMEIVAVAVIAVGVGIGLLRFVLQTVRPNVRQRAYHDYRVGMGKALLLGLEILVAADVVNTVALEPTLEGVATLGLLVVIRTFLGWGLILEIEGRWPWQSKPATAEEHGI